MRSSFVTRHSSFVTSVTLTLCLAYIAYYTPRPHRRGGLLLLRDARRLAAWIGANPAVDPPERDPALALHLVWLTAAGLIARDDTGLHLSPAAAVLLREPPEQFHALLLGDACHDRWNAAAAGLGLAGAVPEPLHLLARQSLQRPPPAASSPLAHWLEAGEEEWQLYLPPDGDPGLLFRLLALGRHEPPGRLHITPLTLAAPPARALGFGHIRLLLETATGCPLDAARQDQLRQWLRRADAHRLRGSLLQTARPEQLAALYARRRLRPFLMEQISPRAALFDPRGLPALRRFLASTGYPLDVLPTAGQPDATPVLPAADAAAVWYGLRLLEALQRTIPLPGPLPHAALDRLAAALPADTLAGLDAGADRLLDELQAVIRGRDPFLPARRPPSEALLARLRAAIDAEEALTIDYTPPGGNAPHRHIIEPLRLEQRADLTYLIAYSRRVEQTLTFRLDRVTSDE